MKLQDFQNEGKCFFVKVSIENGKLEDYGPYDFSTLKQLFFDFRIDGKSFIYCPSFDSWKLLADFTDYQDIFGEEPPEVTALERRLSTRVGLNDTKVIIETSTDRYQAHATDLTMIAVKLFLGQHNLDLDQNVQLHFIDHPELGSEKFSAKIMRLFDSNGDESSLTAKFHNLNITQINKLSRVVHVIYLK